MRIPAALLSAVLLAAALPLPAAAAPPPVWTHNASDRLFPGTTRPAGAPTSIDLYAARNETEAAQLAVRPTAAVRRTTMRSSRTLRDHSPRTSPSRTTTASTYRPTLPPASTPVRRLSRAAPAT
ncbi:hypothetical protein [Kribbella sp. NPDC050470]|uniref:hypothetical protein n=1 Tax=unclassified Kribbella TaxID=2644121 RepID=UPI0037A1723B